MDELENVLAIPREEVILASAKDGTGVAEILEAIVARIPAAEGRPAAPAPGPDLRQPLRRLQGRDRLRPAGAGHAQAGDPIRLMASGADAEPLELGVFRPQLVPVKQLVAGEVGYIATGLKNVRDAQVGDTVTTAGPAGRGAAARLPGGQEPGVRRHLPGQRRGLPAAARGAREAPPQRRDASRIEPESSVALGFGFRCGFLGLLHMEIVQERLEREFDLDLIASAPSVEYHVKLTHGRGRSSSTTRRCCRARPTSRRSRSPGSSSASSRRASTSARSWSSRRTGAAPS